MNCKLVNSVSDTDQSINKIFKTTDSRFVCIKSIDNKKKIALHLFQLDYQ